MPSDMIQFYSSISNINIQHNGFKSAFLIEGNFKTKQKQLNLENIQIVLPIPKTDFDFNQ